MQSGKKLGVSAANFDYIMIFLVVFAVAFGIAMVYSATNSFETQARFLAVQAAAFLIGLVALAFIVIIDYNLIAQWSWAIFLFNIALLVGVLIIGTGGEDVGTKGWFRFGFIGIQPAEIAKVGFAITFAKHLSVTRGDLNDPRSVFLLVGHAAIPIALILRQPDWGTAMVYGFMAIGMLFIAGISWKYLLSALAIFAAGAPAIWFLLLEDYQKQRFFTFLNPASDPTGSGYHVIQSKIAVGSGKLLGKGFMQGTQTQYSFLPEKQTDFIFAVIGEEFGLIGAAIVAILLFAIVWRCFSAAKKSRDSFGELLCVGIGCMFFFHVLENIGMSVGLFPVTGIPLPFFSAGGSSMLTCMMAVGFVLSVGARNRRSLF